MLRSTHTPVPLPPLPPGWTEHTAATGHKYYYHAQTGQSTYTRPASIPQPFQLSAPSIYNNTTISPIASSTNANPVQNFASQLNSGQHTHRGGRDKNRGGRGGSFSRGRGGAVLGRSRELPSVSDDRPKHKQGIPDCDPWVLVTTKQGRRFVHNTETKESFWKFPEQVMVKVVEFDRIRRERGPATPISTVPAPQEKVAHAETKLEPGLKPASNETEVAQSGNRLEELGRLESTQAGEPAPKKPTQRALGLVDYGSDGSDSEGDSVHDSGNSASSVVVPLGEVPADDRSDDEYEYEEVVVEGSDVEDGDEVEYEYVYEDEDGSDNEQEDAGPGDSKRQKLEEPMEFTEDDIAFQLAAMEDYSSPEEAGSEDEDDNEQVPPVSGGENSQTPFEQNDTAGGSEAFAAFLSAVAPPINPFDSFAHVLSVTHPDLPLHDGYQSLRTMHDREQAFAAWSVEEIKRRRQQRIEEQKKSRTSPMVEYLKFLNSKFVGSPVIIMSASSPGNLSWKPTRKPPYWPEVKRKYRKEKAFRDQTRFDDSNREKAYREFAAAVVRPPVQLVEAVQPILQEGIEQLDDSAFETLKDTVLRVNTSRENGEMLEEKTLNEEESKAIIDALPIEIRSRCAWAVLPWRAQAVLARTAIQKISAER